MACGVPVFADKLIGSWIAVVRERTHDVVSSAHSLAADAETQPNAICSLCSPAGNIKVLIAESESDLGMNASFVMSVVFHRELAGEIHGPHNTLHCSGLTIDCRR